ncbi:MAG: TlyA family RNA methyltransferase [Bacillota bacterium]
MRGRAPRQARLDVALVEAGLFGSRQRAQAALQAGLVLVDGRPAGKPSLRVPTGALLEAEEPMPYVGRGGLKLQAALDRFALPVAGRVALDVGASTGGFTDCLLQAGALRVYALDVGTGQLAPSLAGDPRVVNLEGTDIRRLPPHQLDPPPDLAVVDVAFISLRLVLPHVLAQLRPDAPADVVALIKPQFEVGPSRVGKGGVVRNPAYRSQAVEDVLAAAAALGLHHRETLPSPVTGGDGNQEYLAHWSRGGAS